MLTPADTAQLVAVTLHDAAMAACDDGNDATRRGQHDRARVAYLRAAWLEIAAALVEPDHGWRAVFWRSAGWLCQAEGLLAEGAACARRGLAGPPPHDFLRRELLDVLAACGEAP